MEDFLKSYGRCLDLFFKYVIRQLEKLRKVIHIAKHTLKGLAEMTRRMIGINTAVKSVLKR